MKKSYLVNIAIDSIYEISDSKLEIKYVKDPPLHIKELGINVNAENISDAIAKVNNTISMLVLNKHG